MTSLHYPVVQIVDGLSGLSPFANMSPCPCHASWTHETAHNLMISDWMLCTGLEAEETLGTSCILLSSESEGRKRPENQHWPINGKSINLRLSKNVLGAHRRGLNVTPSTTGLEGVLLSL